uniref:F-box domain-containing protein n=1 Tax=Prolemur simus TaxID=1328070 RepID=A0A8C8Z7H4_PROSS
MAESLPLEMLTYILSFLPLSDQKEASLVSRAWYSAAQNALREVRCPPSPGPSSVVSYQLAHGPAHISSIHPSIHSYILIRAFVRTRLWVQCWGYTDE